MYLHNWGNRLVFKAEAAAELPPLKRRCCVANIIAAFDGLLLIYKHVLP